MAEHARELRSFQVDYRKNEKGGKEDGFSFPLFPLPDVLAGSG